MKKKIIISILLLFFVCACGSNQNATTLDLEGASKALDEKYTNMVDMDSNELLVIYGLDVSSIDQYKVKSSTLANGNFYAILKTNSKNKKEVKEQIDKLFSILERQSDLYSPDAVKLIKNRLETSIGDYLIYIVGNDNNELYGIVKEYIK